jgi:hypothetical protein
MKRSSKITQKPLFEIKGPPRARIYRAKFRPLEATKFLDVQALRRTKKTTIEVGHLDVAGMAPAVSAEIRNGKVVALKPVGCPGCGSTRSSKINDAAFKKTIRLVNSALKDRGISTPPLPVPVKISARLGFEIPFGPIIIVIGDPGNGFDLCIEIWIGNKLCWWCVFGPNGCIDFGPPS